MTSRDVRFFSDSANCYAFAVKCANPSGGQGQARPGGAVSNGNLEQYFDALADGVVADGGDKVKRLADFSVQNLTQTQVPAASADWYLIAMLVSETGFHFVRRQRKKFSGSPFWKWKEGNKGLEERSAYDMAAESYIRVTDAHLPSLVKGQYLTEVAGWKFKRMCFFEVHKDGFDVENSE